MHRSRESLMLALMTAMLAAAPPAPPAETPGPKGIWTSAEELASLPMSGPAWRSLKQVADRPAGFPNIRDMKNQTDVYAMAKAIVFARTGDPRYRDEVIGLCREAIGTEVGGKTLALGRNLIGYVIAADLVGLPETDDRRFRAWLRRTLTDEHQKRTLQSTHEDRPNNWGTHAGGSRAAVAAYLGDAEELHRVATVFKGWLGDRSSYAGFKYRDPSWQADRDAPVGINPAGATIDGNTVDGVLPDDQRRGGSYAWPPPKENYVYEAMQGVLAQAVILHRAGYDVWSWQDKAMLRAFTWLHEVADYPAEGDDTWQSHVINHYYDADFPVTVPTIPGKNVGWTDWTLGARP